MRPLKNKYPVIARSIVATILAVSMTVTPAFADTSTKTITKTGTYTEVVPYDSDGGTASTEVLIKDQFNYLDYSPEINVTYSWEEDLEWTYIKNAEHAFWTKGKDDVASWNFAVEQFGQTWGHGASGYSGSEILDTEWSEMNRVFNDDTLNDALGVVISFENKADEEVYLSLEEQTLRISGTNIYGKSYGPTTYFSGEYMQYREMIPTLNTSKTKYQSKTSLSTSVLIGTDTASNTESNGQKGNQCYVAILPQTTFIPQNAWVAENRGGTPVQISVKLIFTKKES